MRRSNIVGFLSLALGAAACTSTTPGATQPPLDPTTTAASTTATAAAPSTIGSPTAATTTVPSSLPPFRGLAMETVVSELERPVLATAPPGDERLFTVEQRGVISIVGAEGSLRTFLDIAPDVGSGSNEQGLLGLAFHPGFATNGRFFVDLTNRAGDTEVREYRVGADPDRADPTSGRLVLEVAQPAPNHNGGMLQFGPDGYLYVGLGDGGGGGDTYGNGQRPDTLLATILRLDVDSARPYAVPPDNPFVAGGGAPEVWAYGLRNPWRFYFDGGYLYIGDVGQGSREEIDVVPAAVGGLNFGWPKMEGDLCDVGDCSGFVAPVITYGHDIGCSVTGGVVYRGSAIPELAGHYLYGDWCGGWVRSFRYDGAVHDEKDWTSDLGTVGEITSFGTDGADEVYITTSEGKVLRLVAVR